MKRSGTSRPGRALLASLALVANLIAAGVPVLHAWAHEVGHAHHAIGAEMGGAEHSHDEVHPLALHEDGLLVHRSAFDLTSTVPTRLGEIETFVTEAALTFHPVAPMASRAPPAPGQARAPPLV